MIFRKLNGILLVCLLLTGFSNAQKQFTVVSDKVKLSFTLDANGKPFYTVWFNNKVVIRPSTLGFDLNTEHAFNKNFTMIGTDRKSVDETWQPVWGETKNIRNNYQELTVHLQQKSKEHLLLDIIFRVFSDGVGFRYYFPKQPSLKYFIIENEQTQFCIGGNYKTFWIPGDYDTNEYPYTVTAINEIDNKQMVEQSTDIAVRVAPDRYAVQTPLMMKSVDGIYINIHEAALFNYPAMQLHTDRNTHTFTSNLVPDAVGNKAYLHAPCATPWRTIIVSDKATDILASNIILNLNDPCKISNTSWIKPMKFIGVWWEMQTGKSTWSYAAAADSIDANGNLIASGLHGANTANVKRYIDFASANGINGVLVEGWNTGWEDWFGNWKENVFDFVTPYPDFNVKELNAYARSKGVQLIMHHETSGSATAYERQMDTAYRFMKENGYNAVKTGYVGKIIPRGEHHDGQWMVNHYERVAQKTASYQIMLDAHEPVRPTGQQRTYPNWMASEAARGNEYNAFSNGNMPSHETILPFTRLMGGPMDYTPGIFKIKGYSNVPERQVHTTLAKQLALYVVFYSPLQMVADLPQNYEAHRDAFQFIKDVPVEWDDSRIIEAEPGEYVTIARKEKNSDSWFLGAITNENNRTAIIKLNFLEVNKKYIATIYCDADNADWKTNPEAYKIEKVTVDSNSVLKLKLAKGGGAAITFIAEK